MAKFVVEWTTGKKEEVEQSDCDTVEQYVNCRFGRGVDLESFGVKVSLQGEESKKESEVPKAATVAPKKAVADQKPSAVADKQPSAKQKQK